MKNALICAALLLVVAATVSGETPSADSATPAGEASSDTAQATASTDGAPRFNLYLPDGEFDIRVRKMIRNVLFEGQVDYNFVNGDISTFLRYKYYARSFTYRLGVFDSIEFASLDSGTEDFNRTRGGLLMFEFPVDQRNRWLALIEGDALTFGDVTNPDHRHDNLYVKLGYQFGAPFDERLNSIVGEVRGRITPITTSYREFGPRKRGLALAVTQGIDQVAGDYRYTKVEAEGLARFDLTPSTHLVSRLHAGTFLQKAHRTGYEGPLDWARYRVPRYEYFRIGGRDALKGLDDGLRGSDEIHLANEIFTPLFRGRGFRTWGIRWGDFHGIGYAGTGNLGYGSRVFTKIGDWVADAGVGVETKGRWRDYSGYLTIVYARTVLAPRALDNSEFLVSLRTAH